MSDLPLSDVRVLDLTRLLPGGFCSLLLADLGAEVLKVEDTGMGDYIRWAPPYYGGEEQQALGTRSALYLSLNRGKRSVRLDLKSEGGREALLRLVERHDVVLDGFRPGVLDRLGVGYGRMREINPALVFCAITGYGQDGPYAQRAGHDMNYLGLVGLLGLTGAKDGPPVQSAGQIADLGGGGLMAAFGVMAALHERERSGEGQMVDVSMADGALSWLAMVAGRYFCDERGAAPRRAAARRRPHLLPPLRSRRRLGQLRRPGAEVLGRLLQRQRPPRPDREAVRGAGLRRLGRGRRGLPLPHSRGVARLQRRARLLHRAGPRPRRGARSELVRAREMVVEMEQPELGTVRQLGVPVKLSRTPGDPTRPAPAFGEHTDEVLREAGYSDEEIAAMKESGAAAGPSAGAEPTEFRA